MNEPIRWLLSKLTDRIFGLIAGSLLREATTHVVLREAEQQDQLENLARQYEEEGKQHLADRLRSASRELTESEAGAQIYQNLDGDLLPQRLLPGEIPSTPAKPRSRRTRRKSPSQPSSSSEDGQHE